jgi:copper transport protein
MRCAQTGVFAGMVLVALAFVRLHLQVIAVFDAWHDVGREQITTLLFHSVWGYGWMLQVAASLAIALSPYLSRRPLDSWMALPLAISASLSGHAASVRGITPLTVGMDSVHILAVGGWVGGIYFVFVSFTLGNSAEVLSAIRRFNAVALTCAAIVVGTGVFAAFVHIPSFFALTSSPYGTALIFKLVFVGVMLVTGAWNWKRGTPALAAGNDRAMRRGVATELLFSLTILLITAALVGLAPPPVEH